MDQNERAEQLIRGIFEATLGERIARRLRVKPHSIIPDHYFSAASVECRELYVAGHFYGCISLIQAVAEAVSRFIAEMNKCKPGGDPADRVDMLHTRKFMSEAAVKAFHEIWEDRNDYHHLNPKIEKDRGRLESRAEECVRAWASIETECFAFSTVKGKLSPKYPKYWPQNTPGTTAVYVDFE